MSPWLKPDPMGTERNPFQVYLLCLAILSGATTIGADIESTSGSVATYLNDWHKTLWSILLMLGASSGLLGMFWWGDPRTGLLIKRFAFSLLCIPVFIYGLVIFFMIGYSGLTVVLTLWGFSVASGVQAWRVDKHIKQVIRKSQAHGR